MKRLVIFLFCLVGLDVWGQDLDIELSGLTPYIQALHAFSNNIPQEKVYLHFDNTSYYQGDNIWFKCYVTSAQHQLSDLSKTLYVELLNPGGELIDKRILKIENGQCHGDFTLNQITFYSGFYEVRAYTKYMLNFGDDVIFSRLLPVFERPKTTGDFAEKQMLNYGRRGATGANGTFQMKREPPLKGKTVNLRFFPEEGNLIQGVVSQVAFEATDEAGNPIDVTGVVMDGNRKESVQFATLHEGRGIFTFTPDNNARKTIAEVEYSGRKYRFDMPVAIPQGVVMEVDNLSHPDSIGITLRKSADIAPEMYGVAVLNGGKLQNYCFAWIEDEEVSFSMIKARLPAGVSQIVLFNRRGEIVCDRLVFTGGKDKRLDIRAKTGKPVYRPFELVDMELSVTGSDANPVQATFSLSVRDGANEVESNHSALTDVLLMSEIKGYVRNPAYYFEDDDETHRAALDLLLMVQGWRRYAWKQMVGVETIALKHLPEQGIATHGTIYSIPLIRKIKPQSDVDVDLVLCEFGKDIEQGAGSVTSFVTDNDGRFSFVSDVEGKWNMILAATEKGKPKNYRIITDRLFSPEPKQYRYADMQVNIADKTIESMNDNEIFDDNFAYDLDSLLVAYQDSLARLGIDEKTHFLQEVTITARRNTKEQDIYRNRSTSLSYYDVASEMDDMYDRGKFTGNNIHELLINLNKNFQLQRDWLLYKGKMPLFVVNYERVDLVTAPTMNYQQYRNINLAAIKSIYINEYTLVCDYMILPPLEMCADVARMFSCVVFIETHSEGEIPADDGKGIRKTWLEGYSPVKEFYSPNYTEMPPEPDYRRTLYWNPMVTPDANGKTSISFYNNSSCTNFSISAETITPLGKIGVNK